MATQVATSSSESLQRLKDHIDELPILSSPYRDPEGRLLELVHLKGYGMIARVKDPFGNFTLVPKDRIYSPLNPNGSGDELLRRIKEVPLGNWDLVFDPNKRNVAIWPHMIAAGNFHISHIHTGTASPVSGRTRGEIREMLINKGYEFQGKSPNGRNESYSNGKYIWNLDRGNENEIPHVDVYRHNKNKAKVHPNIKGKRYKGRYAYKADGGPGAKGFNQTLQKNGLVKSYNSTHSENPAPAKGGAKGDIGGVGCSVEYIEGLFDEATSMLDNEHTFFLPNDLTGPQAPFSNEELVQILHELAQGIYVHGTVPFFSLHFNKEGNLYPVIHPAYAGTLVGQVFSFLDYNMKGYLNGGVFEEEFVKAFAESPGSHPTDHTSVDHLINFKSYCEANLSGEDAGYVSARSMFKGFESGMFDQLLSRVGERIESQLGIQGFDTSIFRDRSAFSNSFRIIAEQKRICFSDGTFQIEPDFKVEYTIKPNPAYQHALNQYRKKYGTYPKEHQQMIQVYEFFKKQIHDHMVKMPNSERYFAMLGVINFFSYYFMTLKKHRRMPILPPTEPMVAGCPSLFPSLPILQTREENISFSPREIIRAVTQAKGDEIQQALQNLNQNHQNLSDEIDAIVEREVQRQLLQSASRTMQREMEKEDVHFAQVYTQLASGMEIWNSIKNQFEMAKRTLIQRNSQAAFNANRINIITSFVTEILPEMIEDQRQDIPMTLPLFIPPGEQTAKESELGRKIVGGCGMVMQPVSMENFAGAAHILDRSFLDLREAAVGKLVDVKGEDGISLGSAFSLTYQDIPTDVEVGSEAISELLSYSVAVTPESYKKAQQLIDFMREGNLRKFRREVDLVNLQTLPLIAGKSLMHLSVLEENTDFTLKLLEAGMPADIADSKGYLPIHIAAAEGALDQMDLLLNVADLLNEQSDDGATPLICAINGGQLDAAANLLERGAIVGTTLHNGYTALHCAVHQEGEEIVRGLLERSTDGINAPTPEGETALMLAAGSENSLVSYLLEKKADPTALSKSGLTALDYAIRSDHLENCETLLPLCSFSESTVEYAIRHCSEEVNGLLVTSAQYRAYKNAMEDTPLILALRYGKENLADQIIEDSNRGYLASENILGEKASSLAAQNGYYSLLEKMHGKGVDLQSKELIVTLLESGYDGRNSFLKDYFGSQNFSQQEVNAWTLVAAKAHNHKAISKVLIPLGADLESVQGENGWGIDHYLAASGGIFLLKKRFSRVADLMQQVDGKSLAYIAGENRRHQVLSFFVDKLAQEGIGLEGHCNNQHLLCSSLLASDVEGAKIIVEKSNDPALINSALDADEKRAVHFAANHLTTDMMEYLYNLGGDITTQDVNGENALEVALRNQREQVADFLLDHWNGAPLSPTAIFYAAKMRSPDAIGKILEMQVNLDLTTGGKTALKISIEEGDEISFLRLKNAGASLTAEDEAGYPPLLLAAARGERAMLEVVFSALSQVERSCVAEEMDALGHALRGNHGDCVEFLIEQGFQAPEDTSVEDLDLRLQAALGNEEAIRRYDMVKSQIRNAVERQDLSGLSTVLETTPANTTFSFSLGGMVYKGTALHLALHLCGLCRNLDAFVQNFLEKEDFDPTKVDSSGNSYAHLLIKNGMDPTQYENLPLDIINNEGRAPIHEGALQPHSIILERLLEKLEVKAQIDLEDLRGLTPVMIAIKTYRTTHFPVFRDQGANLDYANKDGITPMLVAAGMGNYVLIRKLHDAGASAGKLPGSLMSPLEASFVMENEDMTLLFLQNDPSVFQDQEASQAIMEQASLTGNTAIVRILAAKGVSLVARREGKMQPIHSAAYGGKIKVLNLLELMGVNIKTQIQGNTDALERVRPIDFAASKASVNVVQWFLDRGETIATKKKELSVISSAMRNSQANATQILALFQDYLVSNKVDNLFPALIGAISQDYVDPVRMLLDAGIPVNAEIMEGGLTPLHVACMRGAVNVTALLLREEADPSQITSAGRTPIEFSAENDSPSQFAMMLDAMDMDIDTTFASDQTLVHLAAKNGKLAHLILLMLKEADFELVDVQGKTPLFCAAERNHLDVVELLMLCGANPNLGTTVNNTLPEEIAGARVQAKILELKERIQQEPQDTNALHRISRVHHPLAMKLAVMAFNPDDKDGVGKSPLHYAAKNGILANIRILIQNWTEVDIEDEEGNTPLRIAALQTQNPAAVKILLGAGASPHQENGNGSIWDEVQVLGENHPINKVFKTHLDAEAEVV